MIDNRINEIISSYLSITGRSACSISPSEYVSFRKQGIEEEMMGINIERPENIPIEKTRTNENNIQPPIQQTKKFLEPKSTVKEESEFSNVISFEEENKEQALLDIMQAIEG